MLPLLLLMVTQTSPTWTPGTNIQRTMRLLATSTVAKPNRVKILFYGQSITKQDWWKEVEADLHRRFPSAMLTVENRAIGGFAADRLKRTVVHDVFPSYPDLIILHDYGGEPDYEELIQTIRGNVASEVLVQSDHEVWSPKPEEAKPRGEAWHDAHVGWLRELATKYRMGFVDVRTPWQEYLGEKRLQAGELLSDGVHLNEKGNHLMASLVAPALVYDPKLPEDKTLVQEVAARARMQVIGNRIDVTAGAESLQVLIDGKPASEHPELVAFSRPSENFAVDVPAVGRVDGAHLVVEDWTATLTDISADVSHWKFRVKGSVTGDDGEGESGKPFVSRSGRVRIDPKDWYVHEAFNISHKHPPEGFQVRWRAELRGADSVPVGTTVTVANGLANGSHAVELVGDLNGATVAAYRPRF